MKRISILFVFFMMFKFALPQSNVIDFIQAGKEDAGELFQAYLNPYAIALGDGLNNGWFYTAETHKRFGFDISLNMSAVQVPKSDQFFDLNGLSFTNIELIGNNGETPTAAGSNISRPELRVFREKNNPASETLFTFQAPDGAGLNVVPVPMAQISFGLLPHTDLIGRYVPQLTFSGSDDDVKVGLMGIGLKHNFKEWVPFLKHLPFDASVFVAYSKISAESGLEFTAADYEIDPTVPQENNYVEDPNQRLEFNTTSLKYGLIVSKKVGILTVFGGVSNSTSKANIDLVGSYPVLRDEVTYVVIEGENDPITLDFDSSNISMNAGLRLKLAFFKLFGSINKSAYTSYNIGIALGYR